MSREVERKIDGFETASSSIAPPCSDDSFDPPALRFSGLLPAPSVSPPRAADSGVKAATRCIFVFIFYFDANEAKM